MYIKNILKQNLIFCNVKAQSKKQVLQSISQRLANFCPTLNENLLFDDFLQREKLGSTGIGQGIAIPHIRSELIKDPLSGLIQLNCPIHFNAIDCIPVDLVFFILAPVNATNKHLSLLAELAKILNEKEIRQRLRNAHSAHELYQVMLKNRYVEAA